MKYGLINNDIDNIKKVFARFPSVEKVIIFGSRTLNTYREGSDIDLAVIGSSIKLNDILAISVKLEELGLLYKFDLQNYNAIKDEGVLDHIKRAGQVFYSY